MSLKQEIETWVTALAAYDNNEFNTALSCFEQIPDTSKILFNRGVIHATLGEHPQAIQCYIRATQLDKFLAVAYFQQGVSNFLVGDFEEALANFNDALLYLRGHNNIAYEQLGLKFKLYSCEVLFNRGLCYIYLQQKEPGMSDLRYAVKEKMVANHDVIDEAIREHAEGYTVFSIPVGLVFRPNESKVKNLKMKDYLGKARLVAAQDQARQSLEARHQAAIALMSRDDIAQEKLSYAALNLVRPNVRSRQQSEPPLRRNVFPPTPPPEQERPDSAQSTRRSAESSGSEKPTSQASRAVPKPLRLELGAAAFDQRNATSTEKPRAYPRRAESERPGARRELNNRGSDSSGSSTIQHRRRESGYAPHQLRFSSETDTIPEVADDPIEAYSDDVTQALRPSPLSVSHHRSRSSAPRGQPMPIEEEEEEEEDRRDLLVDETGRQHMDNERYRQPTQHQQHYHGRQLDARSPQQQQQHHQHQHQQQHYNQYPRHSATPSNYSEFDDTGSLLSPSDQNAVPLAFEIVQQPRAPATQSTRSPNHPPSAYSHTPPAPAPAPAPPTASELKKIRIKLHAEDMRYVMATPSTTYAELVALVRAKLGLPAPAGTASAEGTAAAASPFKLKIRDEEGDMVVMGDDDDWEMCVAAVRAAAAKEGNEMGKVEVWVQET